MDSEHSAQMQVDLSTPTMSAIQAFNQDPSTKWVIKSAPGFIAIKHKMEKDISNAVADAWPELARHQDNYYCLLEDHNVLKESLQLAKKKAEECRAKKGLTLADKEWICVSDVPMLDGEDNEDDNEEDMVNSLSYLRVIPEAGVPAIGGSHLPYETQKKVYADPPTSITGVLPKPLGKVKAECWDQPALRGASEWILDHSVQDSKIRQLYREGKTL
ncbi:hypothetical protein M422DRAFT_248394 [Sphaerobolus stellatus SS14]|uniref:Uncharacterized protein n=1 Tax=Sphaerobolus stellatus (strain SS14) TaxID=990650 RepID=A0A0C9W4L1_SPHS4|nr:hypothetical protein M422DRAFT_248394 [Sphaerobolus stellatus SS14]